MDIARCYAALGETEKAENILGEIGMTAVDYMKWYITLPVSILSRDEDEYLYRLYELRAVGEILNDMNSPKLEAVTAWFMECQQALQNRLGSVE